MKYQELIVLRSGRPQAPKSATAVSTISDGQPQAPKSTGPAVTIISDSQPQAPKSTATAVSTPEMATMAPVSQITDGQVQGGMHTMTMMPALQISDGQAQGPETVIYMPVSAISDGQPQAPVISTLTDCPASQISDGQPQKCTSTVTAQPASTLSEDQPQAPTSNATGPVVITKSESQSQAPTTDSSSRPSATGTPYQLVACRTNSTLSVSLSNGILKDNQGRTGYIASNYQFQFDGPPQAGAIYTSGFSVCANGSLALGGSNIFWQCLSGNFYNLYDRYWAPQCSPVTIESLMLVSCS